MAVSVNMHVVGILAAIAVTVLSMFFTFMWFVWAELRKQSKPVQKDVNVNVMPVKTRQGTPSDEGVSPPTQTVNQRPALTQVVDDDDDDTPVIAARNEFVLPTREVQGGVIEAGDARQVVMYPKRLPPIQLGDDEV